MEEGEIVDEEPEMKNIVKPGSIVITIYNNKVDKLKLLRQTVLQDLHSAKNKQELSKILTQIIETQKQMPEYLKSVKNALILLDSELKQAEKSYELKKAALIKASILSQKALLGDLETYIKDIKTEMSDLSSKKGTA